MARNAEELFPVQNLPPILIMSMTQCFLLLTKRFHMLILTMMALRRALLRNLPSAPNPTGRMCVWDEWMNGMLH